MGAEKVALFKCYIDVLTKVNLAVDFVTDQDLKRIFHVKTKEGEPSDDVIVRSNHFKMQLTYILLYILTSTLLTIKLLICSFKSDGNLDGSEISRSKFMFGGDGYLTVASKAIHSDFFTFFGSRRLINLMTFSLLLPSVIYRMSKLLVILSKRYNIKVLMKRNSRSLRDVLNVVQVNLTYLYTLNTSWKSWFKMLRTSWFHKHPKTAFWCEHSILRKLMDSAEINQRRGMSLLVMMYIFNPFHFDHCYGLYFDDLLQDKMPCMKYLSKDKTEFYTSSYRRNRSALARDLIESKRLKDNSKGSSSDEHQTTALLCRRSQDIADKLLVSWPLHRVDMGEFGWLIFMVLVLYFMNVLTFVLMTTSYLYTEMNPPDFSWPSIASGFGKVLRSPSILRCLQVAIIEAICLLGTFDLFNFFTCCLICYSRARYLRIHMQRICNLCTMINVNIIRDQDDSSHDSVSRETLDEFGVLESLESIDMESINEIWAGENDLIGFRDMTKLKPNDDSVTALNKMIELVMELLILLQRELSDIQRFFSSYLSLELTTRAICVIFAVLAILDTSEIPQIVFILFQGILGGVPILIVLFTAAFIENEFKIICKTLDWMMFNGAHVINSVNMKNILTQAGFLGIRYNRSFVVMAKFPLSLGSLLPLIGWIATGVVLLRR